MALSIDLDAVVQVREVPMDVNITTLHKCGNQRCSRTSCQGYHSEEEGEYWKFCLVKEMCRNSYKVSEIPLTFVIMVEKNSTFFAIIVCNGDDI